MIKFFSAAFAFRSFLRQLASRDLTAAYTGTVGGNFWVLLNPLAQIVLTLFLFQFVLKPAETHGVPYVAWVTPVVVFWSFASGVLNASFGSIRQYSFLMRNAEFDLRLIAIIKTLSASVIHVFLLAVVLFALIFAQHLMPKVSWLLLLYFYVAMVALLMPLIWLISSFGLFWKDVRNAVGLILQIEFWVNPIFWEPDRFPNAIAAVMYANPFYYPLHGYRAAISGAPIDQKFWLITLYFWTLVFALWFISSKIFRRLERHFGDVI